MNPIRVAYNCSASYTCPHCGYLFTSLQWHTMNLPKSANLCPRCKRAYLSTFTFMAPER